VRRLLAVPLLLLVISACSPSPAAPVASGGRQQSATTSSKTLVLVSAGELPSFSYNKLLSTASAQSSRGSGEHVLNAKLVLLDEHGLPRPFLAEALPTVGTDTWTVLPDGRMELTYRLKPNLTWHDGQPVTAEDFVFAWSVYATPAFGIAANAGAKYIEGVVAPDARTVTVRWKQAYPEAVNETTLVAPLPRHLLELPLQTLEPDAFMSLPFWTDRYVGAGPWKLDDYQRGSFFSGVAFNGFVFGRPKIDRIRVIYRPDPNTMVASILAGEAHFAIGDSLYGEDGIAIEQAWGTTGGTVLYETLNSRVMEFQMRPEFAVPPQLASDRRVRQALAYVIDREPIMEVITMGRGILRDVYTHPDADGYDVIARAAPIRYRPDLQRATGLLQAAGFTRGADGWLTPTGERFTFEEWYLTASNNARESAILVERLRSFGIDASGYQFGTQRTSQEDRSKTPGMFGGNIPDPSVYASEDVARPENRWTGRNRFGYVNPELDRLITAYNTTLDHDPRIQQMAQMERIANEDLPAFPLYWIPRVVPAPASLKGVVKKLAPTAGDERRIWEWSWD
jgi:peptide/nickel transport system substrate-binding protein